MALRYEVEGHGREARILPPGKSSKLFRALQACGVMVGEDEVALDDVLAQMLGWQVRVLVQLREHSRYRDPVTRQPIPLPETARFSVAQHLLSARPPVPPSAECSAVSIEPEAVSKEQPGPPPEGSRSRKRTRAAVERVDRPAPGSQATAPADASGPPASLHLAGADASDGVPREGLSRQSDRRRFWSCETCGWFNHGRNLRCAGCKAPRAWG
jgi:hypothetical protein